MVLILVTKLQNCQQKINVEIPFFSLYISNMWQKNNYKKHASEEKVVENSTFF